MDVLDVLGRRVRFVVPATEVGSENVHEIGANSSPRYTLSTPNALRWKDVEAPTEADWARVSRAHAEKVRLQREERERLDAEREAAIEAAKQEGEARRLAEEATRKAQAEEETRIRSEEEAARKAEAEEEAERAEKELSLIHI